MKTKMTTGKKLDAVKIMREIRDKIDKDTEGMSFEQLKEYYKKSNEENKKQASK